MPASPVVGESFHDEFHEPGPTIPSTNTEYPPFAHWAAAAVMALITVVFCSCDSGIHGLSKPLRMNSSQK